MKILAIGGMGLLGLAGAKELACSGHDLICVSLRPAKPGTVLPNGIHQLQANYLAMTDQDLEDLCRGCEGLLFATGLDDRLSTTEPIAEIYHRYNVDALQRLLRIAKGSGVKRAVICGSYFTHFNECWPQLELAEKHPYIKNRAEQMRMALAFADAEFSVAILELPYIFGVQADREPVWLFLAEMLRSKLYRLGVFFPVGGTAMMTVRQAGQLIAGVMERSEGAKRYPAGYYNMPWHEMLKIMCQALGMDSRPVIGCPKWLFKIYANHVGRAQKKAKINSGINMAEFIDVMYNYSYIDKGLIANQFGVQDDDIALAISQSMQLCAEILDGKAEVKQMCGE